MTSWVIDASVVVKWYVPEELQEQALRLLDLARSGKARFHVPDLLLAEVASILWKKNRRGELTQAEAGEIVVELLQAPKILYSSDTLIASALEIACVSGRSTYDCFYLALAELVGATLITADVRLLNGLNGTPWKQTVALLQSF